MEKSEIIKVLEKCQVIGNSIMVPKTKILELRNSVFEILESLDGVWQGGSSMEIKYKTDPTEKLLKLFGDETSVNCALCSELLTINELSSKITLPVVERLCNNCYNNLADHSENNKAESFNSSHELLASKLVLLAKIQPGDMVAEPSAGRGNIVKAIVKSHPASIVFCYEVLPANQKFLKKISNTSFVRSDFLESSYPWEKFDKIIAFPPPKDEVYHIREMYQRLEIGGTIVTVASKVWQSSKEHKHTAFKTWLGDVNSKVQDISPEELSEIGVTTPFVIIMIKK